MDYKLHSNRRGQADTLDAVAANTEGGVSMSLVVYMIIGLLFFDSVVLTLISLDMSNIYRALDRIAREIKEKKL